MTTDDEYQVPQGHDPQGLAEDMLVDAMLRGHYQDTPEVKAQRVTRAYQALEASPRLIPWHWKAGLSTAAAAIVVLGLILVLSVPQEVQADLAPVLAAFDIGDKTYQIDIGRDNRQPDRPLDMKRRRPGRRPPFRPPRRSMKARLLDGASLYTRGRRYVLTCRGPRGGKIVKGFDGQESWLVTPWGQSKRGQDHSLLQEDLPEHISSLLFLDLRAMLHKIKEEYTLSGPARGTAEDAPLQLEYYIAQRSDPPDRVPECIELWVNTQTNQLYQIRCSGVRFHSQHKSPCTLEIRLLNTDPLPQNWFRQEAHARRAAAQPVK
jgi:hypothetical protein